MIKYEKIIFVGTEDTSRAPMADAIFRSLASDDQVQTMSRGLVVLFPEPYNPKIEMVLKNHNLTLGKPTAVQLAKEDYNENTLFITMTMAEKIKLMKEYEKTQYVYTAKEFVGEEGDVLDPYGGTVVEYEDCFIELSRLMKKMVIKLNEKQ